MLEIQKIDHIGIRIRDKDRSVRFYQSLGFEFVTDVGFDEGHPVMMRHPSGIVLNLLGPTTEDKDENILMDIEHKRYAGVTHIALRVRSLQQAEALFEQQGYPITGRMEFKGMHAVFIRDPDRNVLEFDQYEGAKAESRSTTHKH